MENKTREEVETAAEEKYSWVRIDEKEYQVWHKEGTGECSQHTFIASTDTSEKAHFLSTAANAIHSNSQPLENNSAVWVKAAEPFVKMYNELTTTKKRQGGNIFGFNNAWITVEDLANISKVWENSGASQPTIDSIRVQAFKDRQDRDYWKGIAEKCIAEHPRIVEGL